MILKQKLIVDHGQLSYKSQGSMIYDKRNRMNVLGDALASHAWSHTWTCKLQNCICALRIQLIYKQSIQLTWMLSALTFKFQCSYGSSQLPATPVSRDLETFFWSLQARGTDIQAGKTPIHTKWNNKKFN